jgi:4'-phosphopantetheinyl transferase
MIWERPSAGRIPSLHPGQVHIWRISLDAPSLPLGRYRAELSPDEMLRLDRLKELSAQIQFSVTRGTLRRLLGLYTGRSPGRVVLGVTERGKPFLAYPNPLSVQFNVSHTQGMALAAFTRHSSIGVDVESGARQVRTQAISERFFSADERQQLDALAEELRRQWFFTYWTCKEAYLKMRGFGLGTELAKWEIQPDVQSPKVTVTGLEASRPLPPYSLWRLDPGTGYAGALAVGDSSPKIVRYEWDHDNIPG